MIGSPSDPGFDIREVDNTWGLSGLRAGTLLGCFISRAGEVVILRDGRCAAEPCGDIDIWSSGDGGLYAIVHICGGATAISWSTDAVPPGWLLDVVRKSPPCSISDVKSILDNLRSATLRSTPCSISVL